jgi:hypothetical protein
MPRALPRFVAGVLTLGVVVLILAGLLRPGDEAEEPAATVAVPSAQAPGPASTPPAAEVQRIHDALHNMDTWCTAGAVNRSQPEIERAVDLILSFAQRHPQARFPIDDETGSTLSLLLTTRQELRTCAPTAATRVDRALPPEFQGAPGPP